jgi:hypothetical protein
VGSLKLNKWIFVGRVANPKTRRVDPEYLRAMTQSFVKYETKWRLWKGQVWRQATVEDRVVAETNLEWAEWLEVPPWRKEKVVDLPEKT